MGAKTFLYILVTIVVIWAFDAININQIFKKNHVIQARLFYFLLALSMIQLVTSFLYDFYLSTKIF